MTIHNCIWQSLYLDLVNSNVCAKFYQNIPKGSRDRVIFWIWTSAKSRPTTNGIWQSLWATTCHYQCACKISSQYCTRFKSYGHFHFFRIWSSAKPRLMKNIILQSLGLNLVNINVYAKVYHHIPNGLRDMGFFRELSVDKHLHKLSADGQVWIWTSAKPRPMTNDI